MFGASLVYRVSSKTAKATQRNHKKRILIGILIDCLSWGARELSMHGLSYAASLCLSSPICKMALRAIPT